MRGLAVLVLAFAPGCERPHHARFASWEPTSPEIPATHSRALARARLRQSRALFEQFLTEAPRMFRHLPPAPQVECGRESRTYWLRITPSLRPAGPTPEWRQGSK